ncbi:sigma D regulator [Paraferrimonas sedimenticola]|uniref:Sigma D regulator n=1 Tax=Paraferrimonas sedimenticola TaxID=375674 RepID=A0AA37W277_9GAMM|nr:sigma D regulator [Paraferrimonas sedimenticola]GLP97452.1 sigma D regulator [Paraferrimonas sedimenticola]
MLKSLAVAKEKWGGSNSLIDQWLGHRSQLLASYCELANLPPYEKEHRRLPDLGEIQSFCALVVDYVSEGHFEVYDQVVSACEKTGEENLALARKLMPQIAKTTDFALDFNDKYTGIHDHDQVVELDQDLSKLGQMMETRFDLEDRLLEAVHQVHA